MGEIKSVKVDNWGVFFLQKLQNFFNKTDYCDLTLQFNDNSQLKVHRLVLSACTDYFNVLEQTCEMIEDVLIMPLELQADVVVPIVNFMYTGTLEFELRMYGKLLKTARDMNMTVLLKLLEAHRRTMERNPTQPTNRNTARNSYQKKIPVVPGTSGSNATQRRGTNTTQIIQTKYAPARVVKGPSRFDYPPEGKVLPPETFESSFDTISYESKPLICKEEPDSEDYENLVQKSSPFEELRRGYNNNKRPASAVSLSVFESPPEKKPNIEDVKEYAEQQRVRKQIAQEFDDENEYDETLDDEFHNDDDDEDYIPPQSYQKQTKQPSQQKQTQQKNIQQQTPIVIKQENNRPTIVVKDSPNSNVNHAKIISEVLRKYPHLVKNNKNIKLKILPKSTNTGKNETQKIILKKEPIDQRPVAVTSLPPPSTKHATYPSAVQRSSATAGTSLLQQKTIQQSKANPVKSTSTASTASSSSSSTTASTSTQPRRIDSKTMHSLIAMGAENRTGPWLCLECGVNGRPISIPSYRGFRRHLINTHGKRIDPRLCEHCGWRSTNNRELYHHMLVEHKIKPPSTFNFPKCELCDAVLLSYSELEKHISESHEEGIEVNQNCIYCNKTFANEGLLYAHMKSQHKERAKEDGVIDFSDEENAFESDSQYQSDGGHDSKIKILSDISLPKNIPIIQAEDNAPGTTITIPPEALETNERLIDASQGPRFVNADGKEMELTEEQRREIIAQLENQDHGAVVMVLNDDTINQDETQTTSTSASTSTQMPKSDKSSKSQKELAVVEKDLHKPRKTKHTIRANVDDNEDSEDIIEWLDEESGNIMKVPLSKFSKMGDTEEEDEEDTARETEEGESADEGREDVKKAKDDKSLSINDKNEQEDETTSDSVKDKKHDDEEEDEEEVEEEEEEEEEDDEKEEENKTEKVKDKKTVESKSSKETKSKNKGEMSKALETLKILTGDWTDEEDDAEKKKNEKKNVSTEKSKQAQNKEKEINKEEEILFETIAVAETSTEDVDEKDKKLRKSRSKSRESDINEKDDDNKNDKEKEDNDNDKDDKDDSMDIDTSITTVHDDKLLKDVEDDATDDDMKIIEELKNYEAEQLAAEKEAILKKEEKTLEERLLRRKSKSKSKSASPAISENSNQSDGTSDSNSRGGDKPRKRGRPRKTLSLENQKSKNDNDENNEIVTETEKQKDSDDDENKEKKSESDADNGGNENERDIAAEIKAQLETTDENSQSQSSTKKDEAEEEEEVVEEEEEEDENGKNKSEEVATEKEENEKNKTVADAIAETTELMTKAEIRNLISDWGDDEEDDEEL